MHFRSAARIRKDFQNKQLAKGARNRASCRHTCLEKVRHEAPKHFRVHLIRDAFHRLHKLPPRCPRVFCEIGVQLVNGMREEHPENPATNLEKKKPTAAQTHSPLYWPVCATSHGRRSRQHPVETSERGHEAFFLKAKQERDTPWIETEAGNQVPAACR